MHRAFHIVLMSLPLLVFAGCTHLHGVVLSDPSNRPLTTAKFSIGRPDGVAVFGTYGVDSNGVFDFYVAEPDLTNVYLYDAAGPPQATLRRIDQTEMSDKMKLKIRQVYPDLVPGMN
jgi:hypothetical protein